MCGIAGFSADWPEASLSAALAALLPRGPDGTYRARRGRFALGATRLAIMDPEHGSQPFSDSTGDIMCFGSGEIYNAPELREELAALGAPFRTRCDLEVIPHAWRQWGPAAIPRFNGMFAVALWRAEDDSLHLFRDACGQKPLYWTRAMGRFAFASEIRGLAAAGVPITANRPALSAFLALRYLPGPQTAFEGVEELPPGHHLVVRAGRDPVLRCWDEPGEPPDMALPELVRHCVHDAARSDVPAALYLSGGIDSFLLADGARDQPSISQAITLDFPGGLGEGDAAAEIAGECGLTHHRVAWDDRALEHLPNLVKRLENPVGDPLIVAFDLLAERARDLGVRVVLSGEGPDEWFAGYGFHRSFVLARTLHGIPGALRAAAMLGPLLAPVARRVAGLGQALGPRELKRVSHWLQSWPTASRRERSDGLRRLFANHDLPEILSPDLTDEWTCDLQDIEPLGSDSLREILFSQCRGWLPGWAIGRHEKIALAREVEVRMPFLDRRLRDHAHLLPDAAKCGWRGSKRAWRRVPRHRGRPKQAFAIPAVNTVRTATFRELDASFLGTDALARRGWFRETGVEHLRQRARNGSFLAAKQWSALLMLEIWARGTLDESL